MKKLLTFFVFIFILTSRYIFAQIDKDWSITRPAGESIDLTYEGGIYLTAQGEFKVLVVFIRFKDDVSPHPYWPAGQPPYNYNTFQLRKF